MATRTPEVTCDLHYISIGQHWFSFRMPSLIQIKVWTSTKKQLYGRKINRSWWVIPERSLNNSMDWFLETIHIPLFLCLPLLYRLEKINIHFPTPLQLEAATWLNSGQGDINRIQCWGWECGRFQTMFWKRHSQLSYIFVPFPFPCQFYRCKAAILWPWSHKDGRGLGPILDDIVGQPSSDFLFTSPSQSVGNLASLDFYYFTNWSGVSANSRVGNPRNKEENPGGQQNILGRQNPIGQRR